jgi:tetratricopeptide (TPR) repeat protein
MLLPKLIHTFILALLFQNLQAQSTAAVNKIGAEGFPGGTAAAMEKSALKSKLELDHYAAMKYNELWLKTDTTAAALKGYAESAIAFSAYQSADEAYGKLLRLFPNDLDGVTLLNLANAKYHLGKYTEAKEYYQNVLNIQGESANIVDKAQSGIEACDWVLDVKNETNSTYLVEKLPYEVNSDQNDFAPFPMGDTLYYSTFRFPFPKDKAKPARNLIKVRTFISSDAGEENYTANFNEESKHTANVTFDATGNTMFYTNCTYQGVAAIQCELYKRTKSTDGTWGNAIKLPELINIPGFTTTQPNVGIDKSSGNQVLYYASDRSDGKGKLDIWSTQILVDQSYTNPVNLSEINTIGDDVTPFFHNKTNTLYFSTDGLKSLGGTDIYKSRVDGITWTSPEHLDIPLNSNRHDLYYVLSNDGTIAYLASNRDGSDTITAEACCMDIYKVQKPDLVAVTFNKTTKDSLFTTTIRLIEVPDVTEELKLKIPGSFVNLDIQLKKQYWIIASKDGFISDTLKFESPEKMWKGLMVKKLYLEPAYINLVASVFNEKTKEPIKGATFQFIDLGLLTSAGTLATGRGLDLSGIDTKIIENSNSNNYTLSFNHLYKVIVKKEGFGVDTVEVSTAGYSTTTTLFEKLYLNRGINLIAQAFDKTTNQPLLGTNIRFIEVENKNLKTDSKENSHEYEYGLNFERSYWVVISKKGYTSDSVLVKTYAENTKLVKNQTILEKLYLQPSKLVSFLPLSLYFDNDEPDKRTNANSTKKSYSQTYNVYYPRKHEFTTKYLGEQSNKLSDPSHTRLINFFDEKVKGGHDKLLLFSAALKERLQAGDKVEITIRGFASPRAASEYNKNLTSRRISSVRNHFSLFENGIFNQYFKNGQLILREEPNGEEKAPTGISDLIPDERNSVFSVDASLERRVELIEAFVTPK